MKIVKININKIDKSAIDSIVNVLKSGGIVVHPTDTCYGLAANIQNRDAVRKIFEFKKRPTTKHLSIIADGKEMFERYGHWSPLIDKILHENHNKMYSFVVKKTNKLPQHFNEGTEGVAIQIPRSNFSLEMLRAFKDPLTATSANISSQPSVYSIEDLIEQIKDKTVMPDLIIDAGRLPKIKPSTIIRINKDGYEILRS